MGAQILIRLESDKYDEGHLAPFLGRDFHWEIAKGNLWKDANHYFLDKREAKLLDAPFDENLEEEFKALIHPKELLQVIEKVKLFLKNNDDTLPYEIMLDSDKMSLKGLDYPLMLKNSRCWIQGDSYLYEVNERVKIVNYPQEPNEVELWLKVKDEIIIEDRTYYLKKETRFEKFEESLSEVIEFCKYAISRKEKIYWVYSH